MVWFVFERFPPHVRAHGARSRDEAGVSDVAAEAGRAAGKEIVGLFGGDERANGEYLGAERECGDDGGAENGGQNKKLAGS